MTLAIARLVNFAAHLSEQLGLDPFRGGRRNIYEISFENFALPPQILGNAGGGISFLESDVLAFVRIGFAKLDDRTVLGPVAGPEDFGIGYNGIKIGLGELHLLWSPTVENSSGENLHAVYPGQVHTGHNGRDERPGANVIVPYWGPMAEANGTEGGVRVQIKRHDGPAVYRACCPRHGLQTWVHDGDGWICRDCLVELEAARHDCPVHGKTQHITYGAELICSVCLSEYSAKQAATYHADFEKMEKRRQEQTWRDKPPLL